MTTVSADPTLPVLSTPRLRVAHVAPGHEAETVAFFTRNRQHFARWDPPAPKDFYSVGFWKRSVARAVDDFHADRAVRFDLFDGTVPDSRRVIGRLGFSQIFRGPFQSCILGYQIDANYEGRGVMFEALTAAIGYMFDEKRCIASRRTICRRTPAAPRCSRGSASSAKESRRTICSSAIVARPRPQRADQSALRHVDADGKLIPGHDPCRPAVVRRSGAVPDTPVTTACDDRGP